MMVTVAVMYTFVFQNPVFQADVNSLFAGSKPEIQVAPYLPASTSTHWTASGLAYACSGTGPGLIVVSNPGSSNVTIVSVTLDYGGQTYSAVGPSCSATPGQSTILVTSLGAPAGSQGSQFSGYVRTSDGSNVSFSGTWV